MATNPNSAAEDSADESAASDAQPNRAEAADPAVQGRAYAAMVAARNGHSPPELDSTTAASVGQLLSQSSPEEVPSTRSYPGGGGRRQLMGPGMSHDGDRDIWGTLGYPEQGSLDAAAYLKRYERQDLARAIISIPVETTWKEYPTITDTSDPETESPFEEAIGVLEDGTHLQQNLLHYFEWADRLQRIGEYGLLFLGFDDGRSIDQPVNADALDGPEDVTYIQPFSQASVSDWELAGPDSNEREPGMPITYQVKFQRASADDTPSVSTEERTVHYTRVAHLVEQPEQSVLKHTPVLEPIVNRLIDHEKVVGSAAEMFWSSADRKFFAKAEGGSFNEEDIERFDRQMWQMVNGMRTTAAGENIDLEVIDGQSVDPSGIIEAIIKSIVSVVGIPMRKLLGSERGELASSMDQATWFGKIEERQQQFAEPVIVRQVIRRFIDYGVVPAPENGTFDIAWPDLYELTAEDESQIQKNQAQAIQAIENAIALGAPRDELYRRVLDLEPAELEEAADVPSEPADEVTGEFPSSVTTDPPTDEATPPRDATGAGAGVRGGATLPENHATATAGDVAAQGAPSTRELVAWAPNAQYSEGDVVATPNGRGVVSGVLTDDFDFPQGTEETTEVSASSDQPAYLVGLERGGSAPYRASALLASSFDAESPVTDGDALASIVDEGLDTSLPPDWDRQSLLRWWAEIGGTWEAARDAVAEADGFSGDPERLASRMRDAVLATKRWRNRF